MHARQQIREAVATLLTGLNTTGANVHTGRVYPLETLPALSVFTLSESVEGVTLEGIQHRRLILAVEGRAKANSDIDDALDTIAEEVETAIYADQYLSNTLLSMELGETEIEMFDDLEKPAGVVRLLFTIEYTVNQAAPSTLV